MNKEEEIARICESLGAPPGQAGVMARQLLKRAGQLAAEHDVEEVQALDYLLRLTISGRQGQTPPQPPWQA